MTEQNASAVARICERLDGIPLAIELAAARTSTLTPSDLLDRLDQSFRLLTGGSRTALERHQTLQAAVDWSYSLLSVDEQRLFDRLSVFVGTFSLDAVCIVAADGGDDVVVLDLLGSLIAKSMVIADEMGGSLRYRLLETLRQYGRDRLAESGTGDEIRDRHAEYYLSVTESITAQVFGFDDGSSAESTEPERDNVRAAFEWLLESRNVDGARRAISSIAIMYASSLEWLVRCERALELTREDPPELRASALASVAATAFDLGDHNRADELARASLDLSAMAGLEPSLFAVATLGMVAFWRGQPEQALAIFDRAEQVDDAPYDTAMGRFLLSLSFVATRAGQTDRAIEVAERNLAGARALGSRLATGTALITLAFACLPVDPERARAAAEEVAGALDLDWDLPANAMRRVMIGVVRASTGDDGAALEMFIPALAYCRRSGERFVLPNALESTARSLGRLGDNASATRLMAATVRFREEAGARGAPGDDASRARAEVRLRAALGDETFEAEWAAGLALSADEAILLAIAAGTADVSKPRTP